VNEGRGRQRVVAGAAFLVERNRGQTARPLRGRGSAMLGQNWEGRPKTAGIETEDYPERKGAQRMRVGTKRLMRVCQGVPGVGRTALDGSQTLEEGMRPNVFSRGGVRR